MKSFLLLATLLWLHFISLSPATAQTYFEVGKDFPCPTCSIYSADFSKIKPYTRKEAETFFKGILDYKIEFGFPQGACQQRAQIMSLLLDKEFHVSHFRVWLFGPVNLKPDDARKLEITDPNGVALNNKIYWNYHVAPAILVTENGKTDTLVIDPSLDATKPLLLKDWLGKIGNSKISKYTFLNSQWYLFNTINNGASPVLNGYFYDYETYDDKLNLTVEKGMAINDLAVHMISKYIKPLSGSGNPADQNKLNGLKLVFGDVSVMEKVFSLRKSGLTNNTTLRYLFQNYSDIMQEAYSFYDKRLISWSRKTDLLLNKL